MDSETICITFMNENTQASNNDLLILTLYHNFNNWCNINHPQKKILRSEFVQHIGKTYEIKNVKVDGICSKGILGRELI